MSRLLLCSLLILGTSSLLSAQVDCQLILPGFGSTSHTIDGTTIDACVGDVLEINAALEFPENDQTYTQSEATSSFDWTMGSFAVVGQSVSIPIEEDGYSNLLFTATDISGCDTTVVLTIRAAGPPSMAFSLSSNAGSVCLSEGDTVTISASVPDGETTYQDVGEFINHDDVLLPDGTGASYFAYVNVDGAAPDATVADVLDDLRLCLNIEHSWMRDLEIILYAPDGSSLMLVEQMSVGGEVFLGIPNENDEGSGTSFPGLGFTYCWTANTTNPDWVNFANMTGAGTLPPDDYSPVQPFASIATAPVNGTWTFQITDNWAVDNGYVFFTSIEIPSITSESFTTTFTNAYWSDNGANIVSADGNELVVTVGSGSNSYTYFVEDDFGCTHAVEYVVEPIDDPGSPDCTPCSQLHVDAGPDVFLECGDNQLVTLVPVDYQTGPSFTYTWTNSNGIVLSSQPEVVTQEPGIYTFTQTRNSDGCTLSDEVEVIQEFLELDFGSDTLYTSCTQDFLELFPAPGGGSGNFLFSINGVATQELPLVILSEGPYVITVQDLSLGCIVETTIFVQFGDGDITGITTVPADCDESNGSATVETVLTPNNYSIAWSNGQTGPTATGLAQGWYSVTVSNADCTNERAVYVDEDESCKAILSGYVYLDDDCTVDASSQGVPGIMLRLLPDDVYTYTDSEGFYEFVSEGGADYTIEYIEEDAYDLQCPVGGQIAVGVVGAMETVGGKDFFVAKAEVANLCVDAFATVARPGFQQYNSVAVCNFGCEASPATLSITIDTLAEFSDASIFDTYDPLTRTATLEIAELQPGECFYSVFFLNIQIGTLGEPMTTSFSVVGDGADAFPGNNELVLNTIIIGSYDPNDKQNRTGEDAFGGAIYEQDTTMRYQIRFQNTGTDTAFTVVIRDTLDVNLDVTTIRAGLSSHDYELEFEGSDVLVFRFENILLPDSTTNLEGSNGFVNFTIDRRGDLPLGTNIANTAAIYFDFNEPVITNTVVNVLSEPVANREPLLPELAVQLFPNPTSDRVQLSFEVEAAGTYELDLLGLDGRLVRRIFTGQLIPGTFRETLSLGDLPTGEYFLQIRSAAGAGVVPLSVVR